MDDPKPGNWIPAYDYWLLHSKNTVNNQITAINFYYFFIIIIYNN
jgi:hypothetical protein